MEGENIVLANAPCRLTGCLLGLLWICGCGQSNAPSPTASAPGESETVAANNEPTPLPTAALSTESPTPDLTAQSEPAPEPVEGSPEWLLREIQRTRLLPLPIVRTDADLDDDNDSDTVKPASVTQPEEGTPGEKPTADLATQLAQTRAIRRERNLEIVKLATDAIRQTAKDPKQEVLFLAAVQQFLDAHFQLALQGDQESIEALYEAAEAFHTKRAESAAASESQLVVVNLTHANALRHGKSDPRWLQEFARQSQLFATRFPSERVRALPLLMAAGRSAEANGLIDEAQACYSLVQQQFPESPQAQQCAGVMRRMNLIGQPLQLAGPTIDGNFVSVEDSLGKGVIVVFWSTSVKSFADDLPTIQSVAEKYKKYATVISVNLDSEEGPVDAFLEQQNLTWPVIFHVEPEKRGWNSPVALYYGVQSVPTIWIVDSKGVVAETQVTAAELEAKLRPVLLKNLNAGGTKAAEKSPAGAN